MHKGSCLCGEIKYEVSGSISNIIFCHCSQCRKAQGSAFGSNGFVDTKNFRFISGESNLSSFESSPGKQRCFCKKCGSPILSKRYNDPERLRVRLGTLDTDVTENITGHLFAPNKANWYDITDELPQHDHYEPNR